MSFLINYQRKQLVPEYIEKFFLKASEKLGLKMEKRKNGFYRIANVPYKLRKLPFEFKMKFGEV